LSNGENGPITDGHRAGAKFRLPERKGMLVLIWQSMQQSKLVMLDLVD
jgi:hypothetical protein